MHLVLVHMDFVRPNAPICGVEVLYDVESGTVPKDMGIRVDY